ncbi:hypothetical protein SDJN03_22463, partial [Cucurbita argyrosperma subsp. sororia]
MKKLIGVREARTLDLRITLQSYETYALANCATTPADVILEALRYTLTYLDLKETDEPPDLDLRETIGAKTIGVREARTLDPRITLQSYETYALANCATTPADVILEALRYTLTYLDLRETDEKTNWEKPMKKLIGVREVRTLDLRITLQSYETYALANCATTPADVIFEALRYTLTYLDLKETDEPPVDVGLEALRYTLTYLDLKETDEKTIGVREARTLDLRITLQNYETYGLANCASTRADVSLEKPMKRTIGVREARTLDLRITLQSYETYALANCATTPADVILEALRYALTYLDLKETDEKSNGVREAQTLDLRITLQSYETYALANCATTPADVSLKKPMKKTIGVREARTLNLRITLQIYETYVLANCTTTPADVSLEALRYTLTYLDRKEIDEKTIGVREAQTLDLRITLQSYETYALTNCATTQVKIITLQSYETYAHVDLLEPQRNR